MMHLFSKIQFLPRYIQTKEKKKKKTNVTILKSDQDFFFLYLKTTENLNQ